LNSNDDQNSDNSLEVQDTKATQVIPVAVQEHANHLAKSCEDALRRHKDCHTPAIHWDSWSKFDKTIEQMEDWLDNSYDALKPYCSPMPLFKDFVIPGSENVERAIFTEIKDVPHLDNSLDNSMSSEGSSSIHTVVMGEICPSYWRPIVIDIDKDMNSWNDHGLQSLFEHDVEIRQQSMPWWKNKSDKTNWFLPEIAHEVTKINAEDENNDEQTARLADKGSQGWCDAYNAQIRHKSESKKQKRALQQELAICNQYPALDPQQPDAVNGISYHLPKANNQANSPLVLRPATLADVGQMTWLYNRHVCSGASTSDITPIQYIAMSSRLRQIQSSSFPFLVAQHGRRSRILGFAFADDYNDEAGMYRYTCEIEIYIHPEHAREGICTALLDKMMSLLDVGYSSHINTYTTSGNPELEKVRRVKNIMIKIPFYQGKRPDGLVNWLTREHQDGKSGMGFDKVAEIDEMGLKNGKKVDLILLRKKTKEIIEKTKALIVTNDRPAVGFGRAVDQIFW